MKKGLLTLLIVVFFNLHSEVDKEAKIYVAGHSGLVGNALCRKLLEHGYDNLILRTGAQLDLRDTYAVDNFFKTQRPDYVFIAAAQGRGLGIKAAFPVQLLSDNVLINFNIIRAAFKYRVKKLLFLGSPCIYPKLCPQPIKEEYLLTGKLDPSNEAYAISKIAGLKLCQAYNQQFGTNFISCIPTNLYGPYDNFDWINSRLIPSLMVQMHIAKINNAESVILREPSNVQRELLYVGDFAEALLFLMNNYDEDEIINVGYGSDVSVSQIVQLIKEIVGFKGKILFEKNETPEITKRLLNNDKITALGWQPKTTLRQGLEKTYEWFCQNCEFLIDIDNC